jgi:hypothetical protein
MGVISLGCSSPYILPNQKSIQRGDDFGGDTAAVPGDDAASRSPVSWRGAGGAMVAGELPGISDRR